MRSKSNGSRCQKEGKFVVAFGVNLEGLQTEYTL
jgi:hypothetical protein